MDPQSPMPPASDPSVDGLALTPDVPQESPASAPVEATSPSAAPNIKQQVVEIVNGAKNVLVTVGTEPSVDELSAALGLTFLLGKLGKHATAVFSGKTPPAIDFLDPDKTFERTVDSLRDFIIALDKEKADKLRYKVEDDVVKVYITPYRTTITEKDLEFSQGDFNVDAVIALGVTKQDELDKAITAHGRILHDAEVITINANGKSSDLGSVDWVDAGASSLSEMLMSISESFGSGLVDEQISTAFLTGIVAETNRFSNEKTSPKVMTMAAQLMAAGANQQLIASNLRQEGAISESVRTQKSATKDDASEVVLDHSKKSKKDADKNEDDSKSDQSEDRPIEEQLKEDIDTSEGENDEPKKDAVSQQPSVPELPPEEPVPKIELKPEHHMMPARPKPKAQAAEGPQNPGNMAEKPDFGGELNATTTEEEGQNKEQLDKDRARAENALVKDEALAEARKEIEDIVNSQPFDPANKPLESIGAQELPPVHAPDAMNPDGSAGETQATTASQNQAALAPQPEPSPMDSFMEPHNQIPTSLNEASHKTIAPLSSGDTGDLPPLPPLPPMPSTDSTSTMPPLPPVPGQPQDPVAGFQPQTTPDFMQNVPQSQNTWTQAGDELAGKKANKEAVRQEKLEKLAEQYDAAVEKNRELSDKPPQNEDHSTFPLPPSK